MHSRTNRFLFVLLTCLTIPLLSLRAQNLAQLTISQSASDDLLNWASGQGVIYQIQASTDLLAWNNVGSTITGNNQTVQVPVSSLSLPTASRRFFRLSTTGAVNGFAANFLAVTSADNARTLLGLRPGIDVQAYSAMLSTWALKIPPSGTVVGTSDKQTLTGKSISSDQITPARIVISNAAYSIQPNDRLIEQAGILTVPIVFTLPAASSVPAGTEITVRDISNTVSNTNTITIQRAGSDTISVGGGAGLEMGKTSEVISEQKGVRVFISNGNTNWQCRDTDFARRIYFTLSADGQPNSGLFFGNAAQNYGNITTDTTLWKLRLNSKKSIQLLFGNDLIGDSNLELGSELFNNGFAYMAPDGDATAAQVNVPSKRFAFSSKWWSGSSSQPRNSVLQAGNDSSGRSYLSLSANGTLNQPSPYAWPPQNGGIESTRFVYNGVDLLGNQLFNVGNGGITFTGTGAADTATSLGIINTKRGTVDGNIFFSQSFQNKPATASIDGTIADTGQILGVTGGQAPTPLAANLGGYVAMTDSYWYGSNSNAAFYINALHTQTPSRWGAEISFHQNPNPPGILNTQNFGSFTLILRPNVYTVNNMIHCTVNASGFFMQITAVDSGPATLINLGQITWSSPLRTDGTHYFGEVSINSAHDTVTIKAGPIDGSNTQAFTITDSRIAALFAGGRLNTPYTTYESYCYATPGNEKVRIYNIWAASDASPATGRATVDAVHSNAVSGVVDAVSLGGYAPTPLGLQLLSATTPDDLANLAGQFYSVKTNASTIFDFGTSQTFISDGGLTPSKGLRISKPDGGIDLKTFALQSLGDGGFAINQLTDSNAFSFAYVNFAKPTTTTKLMGSIYDGTRYKWGPVELSASQGASIAADSKTFRGQPGSVTALVDAATIPITSATSNAMQISLTSTIGSTRKMGTLPDDFAGAGYKVQFYIRQPPSGGPCNIVFTSDNRYSTAAYPAFALSTNSNAVDFLEFYREPFEGTWCLVNFVKNIK